MSGTVDRERLRQLLAERGRTARDVSRKAAGVGDTAVKDILSGKSKNPEYATLAAIAAELGVSVQDFTTESVAAAADGAEGQRIEDRLKIVPRFLAVRYRVRAGYWAEVEFEEPPEQISAAVVPDPRFSNWPQWLELIEGDSINLKIPPGHYAHVVDAIEMGYSPRDRDWVVVERRRNEGRERERTIKQIEIGRDGIVRLRARSTNPKWEKHTVLAFKNGRPVTDAGEPMPPGETIEVEIVGLVIGSYDPDF